MGSGQAEAAIVGTWKLVSVTSIDDAGRVNEAVYGPQPSGLLTYTADRRMAVVIAEDPRTPLSLDDKVAAPAEERASAFSTFSAYAGRYTFQGGKVVHHVEVASMPNWTHRDVVRLVELEGDHLRLRTPRLSRGGTMLTLELVWERV